MQIRRTAAALMSAAALSVTGVAMATPAQAAPTNTAVGGAAGLVAAVLQLQTGDIDVAVIDGDVNVAVENVLNNNRVLQNFLNNNTVVVDALNDNKITLEDVVDIRIVDNVLILVVDVL